MQVSICVCVQKIIESLLVNDFPILTSPPCLCQPRPRAGINCWVCFDLATLEKLAIASLEQSICTVNDVECDVCEMFIDLFIQSMVSLFTTHVELHFKIVGQTGWPIQQLPDEVFKFRFQTFIMQISKKQRLVCPIVLFRQSRTYGLPCFLLLFCEACFAQLVGKRIPCVTERHAAAITTAYTILVLKSNILTPTFFALAFLFCYSVACNPLIAARLAQLLWMAPGRALGTPTRSAEVVECRHPFGDSVEVAIHTKSLCTHC